MAKAVPMKLRYLKVNPKILADSSKKNIGGSCSEHLTNVLDCWRLSGIDSLKCLGLVRQLTICNAEMVK